MIVGERSALWASGSDPADASADVSMHVAQVSVLPPVYRGKRLKLVLNLAMSVVAARGRPRCVVILLRLRAVVVRTFAMFA